MHQSVCQDTKLPFTNGKKTGGLYYLLTNLASAIKKKKKSLQMCMCSHAFQMSTQIISSNAILQQYKIK